MQRPRLVKPASVLFAALLLAGCSAMRTSGDERPAVSVTPAPVPTPTPVAEPLSPPLAAPPAHVVPRIERIAKGAPNAPYEVRGESYDPENADVPIAQTGIASWYGRPFHGRRTASGEIYDMHALSAAHKTMPLPSYARVRNPANGREVIVRINDRGPFKRGRIIDLSHAAAKRLRINGTAVVEVTRLTHDAIRSGAWKRPVAQGAGKVDIARAE